MTCEHINGRHYCSVHDELFRNNMEANEHSTRHGKEACSWWWVCLDCGETLSN